MAELAPMLIVGLGNPGPQYSYTRHNIGTTVVHALLDDLDVSLKFHKRSGADTVSVPIQNNPVVLARLRCFMNNSGNQVRPLAQFYSIPTHNIIVVHDDLDLEFGKIRLKYGGGAGGHNGLRSITSALATPDYYRVRIGIGRPPGRQEVVSFVLENFNKNERDALPQICDQANQAIHLLITRGLTEAQNTVHSWNPMV